MHIQNAVKTSKRGYYGLLFLGNMAFCVLCLIPLQLFASDIQYHSIHELEKIDVFCGKALIVKNSTPIKRVYIANPEVAKADVFSNREIVLTGIAPGSTTMTIWKKNKTTSVYTVRVKFDVTELKEKLHTAFPDEKELRVQATNTSISLSGRISSVASLAEILALAQAYAPEDKVNNFIQVGGVHQVMLEVRVAEMSKSLIKRFGINFSYLNPTGDFFVNTLGSLTSFDSTSLDLSVADTVNTMFSFNSGSSTWTGFIDALKNEGLVKVLAEPTLIAQSGQSADFLAGGEFPVPITNSDGDTEIEYKQFGVGLSFSPKVLQKGKISIQVQPEVSELDYTTAVQSGGVAVPGLSTRRASTTVELGDGQSFAIAGLLSESIQDNVEKFPFLGDIPVLGALFRSKSFQKSETELVIIVTPHLVKPLDMAKMTLPTDNYREPNDVEFYILGLMQGREPEEQTLMGKMDGEFGHVLPEMK
jgi:pilus assembly protein CpaC